MVFYQKFFYVFCTFLEKLGLKTTEYFFYVFLKKKTLKKLVKFKKLINIKKYLYF